MKQINTYILRFTNENRKVAFHCKEGTPYNQTLRLNCICCSNEYFVERCNDLEIFLKRTGYSSHMVRKEIPLAKKRSFE